MAKDEPMVFCIGTSDEYAKYAAVTITSVCVNNLTRQKEFHIISDSLEKDTIEMLNATAKKFELNLVLHILDFSQFDWVKMDSRWTRITLFPLILNEIMPPYIDRCLCLEVDTMITGNISDFYDIELGNNIMAGSPIGFGIKPGVKSNNLAIDLEYIEEKRINAGVILFNIKKIREEGIGINYYHKRYFETQRGMTTTGETILNNSHVGRIIYINPALFHYRSYFHNIYLKRGYKTNNKKIVHFTDRRPIFQKPWIVFFEDNPKMYFNPCEGIQKEVHNLIQEIYSEWWYYAKSSVNYSNLRLSMEERSEFYKKYIWPIIDETGEHKSDKDKTCHTWDHK